MIDPKKAQEVLVKHLKRRGKKCHKKGLVRAYRVKDVTRVETVINEKLETINQAREGDYIVTNQTRDQESYVVAGDRFEKLYKPVGANNDDGLYQNMENRIGMRLTAETLDQLDLPESFDILAPWGENQRIKRGDYIVATDDFEEAYGVEESVFESTYEWI